MQNLLLLAYFHHLQHIGGAAFAHARAAGDDVLLAALEHFALNQHAFHFVQRGVVVAAVASISGRTPRYIAMRRWAEMLGVKA